MPVHAFGAVCQQRPPLPTLLSEPGGERFLHDCGSLLHGKAAPEPMLRPRSAASATVAMGACAAQGHLRLVLATIVYNAMAQKAGLRALPLFRALSAAMRASTYSPLLTHPPADAAEPRCHIPRNAQPAAHAPAGSIHAGNPFNAYPRALKSRRSALSRICSCCKCDVLLLKGPKSARLASALGTYQAEQSMVPDTVHLHRAARARRRCSAGHGTWRPRRASTSCGCATRRTARPWAPSAPARSTRCALCARLHDRHTTPTLLTNCAVATFIMVMPRTA